MANDEGHKQLQSNPIIFQVISELYETKILGTATACFLPFAIAIHLPILMKTSDKRLGRDIVKRVLGIIFTLS